MVYEIRAGIAKHYLAVGDKIMYNKLVGEIVRITHNGDYRGTPTLPASNTLTRHGHYKQSDSEEDDFELEGYEGLDIDKIIEEGKEEDLLRQASHAVTIKLENDEELTLSAVGDFSPQIFSLGYALTVHKAQGCEWRTVYLVLHKCHSTMAFRELFYTAVTRAATNCVIFAKDFMVKKAIATQRIKGNTLKEKLEFFNSGAVTMSDVPILKTSL
jgi:hypothetical protein